MGLVKCLRRLTSSNNFACGIDCATNSACIFIKTARSLVYNKYFNPITVEQT